MEAEHFYTNWISLDTVQFVVFFQLNVSLNARLFNELRALTNLRNIFTAFAVGLIECLEDEFQKS